MMGKHALAMSAQAWSWLPEALRAEPRWLKGMSWRRIAWLFAIVLGLALFSAPSQFVYEGVLLETPPRDLALSFFQWFVRYLAYMAPILVAVTIADNLPLTGARRVAALVAAIVLGAQVQWPIVCSVSPAAESGCDDFPRMLWRSWTEMLGSTTIWAILDSAPIALAYFYRRRDLQVAEALHAAEVARADAQRRTLESELQAMQARVEPAFLFDTLGDIGELFDRDPPLGERMLDELILYLRAALPEMRAARSTLRQEGALAHAYLSILEIRAQGRLRFDVAIPDSLADDAVPPMMILPLLAAAIGPVAATDPLSSLRIDALADGGRLRIAVTGRGPALRSPGDTPVADDVRERLRTLFHDRASVTIDAEPGHRLTAVIELPRDRA